MCCAVAILFAFGPRAAILVWWLIEPLRWGAAFDTFLWPFLGFLVLPWTMLVYGIAQTNGMTLLNWIFLGLAFLIDLGTWGVGAFAARERASSYRGT